MDSVFNSFVWASVNIAALFDVVPRFYKLGLYVLLCFDSNELTIEDWSVISRLPIP